MGDLARTKLPWTAPHVDPRPRGLHPLKRGAWSGLQRRRLRVTAAPLVTCREAMPLEVVARGALGLARCQIEGVPARLAHRLRDHWRQGAQDHVHHAAAIDPALRTVHVREA